MGRHFCLQSDHKPLLALFGEHKDIPQMAAGRLQRWALFLSGFDYTMEYIKGKNNGSDAISRLPTEPESSIDDDEGDYLNFLVEDKLPVDANKIRKENRVDPILSKVYLYAMEGWPSKCEYEELKPYFLRSHEISVDNGILMWGYRVIIPQKFRNMLIEELHSTHMGSSKMKSLARQYFWWPKLDQDLESCSRNCNACNKIANNPCKSELIKYEQCKEVNERMHMDFLGPLDSSYYLIMMDAYSKWPEVFKVNSLSSENTVDNLREYCSRFGLPKKIISDNGKQLVSNEFEYFCETNGIRHNTGAAYNPPSNGAAENAVKSFKSGLRKALIDPRNSKTKTKTLVARYLFAYRNTPHCFTGETPAKLMFKRKLRTRFDLMRDQTIEKNIDKQVNGHAGRRNVSFEVNDVVWVRDYRKVNKPTWIKARIIDVLGPRNYACKILGEDIVWKRHIDQIRSSGNVFEYEFEKMTSNDSKDVKTSGEIFVPNFSNYNDQTIDASDEKVKKESPASDDQDVIIVMDEVNSEETNVDNDKAQASSPKVSRKPNEVRANNDRPKRTKRKLPPRLEDKNIQLY